MLALTASPARAEKRVALVIGNSEYVHVPRLAITGARFDFLFSQDVGPRAFPNSEEWQSAPAP